VQHGMFCPDVPSHLSHPMSQPLLNQKQAWPFEPESLRGSVESLSGWAHLPRRNQDVSSRETSNRVRRDGA
jgi:hypothetical protein